MAFITADYCPLWGCRQANDDQLQVCQVSEDSLEVSLAKT